jgi:endonuclease/exonuclease/phosphatase family metal-dependent hydrolase
MITTFNRVILYIFLLASFCNGCSKDPVIPDPKNTYFQNSVFDYKDTSLRILTYNIQLGFTDEQNPFDENSIGASPDQIHNLSNIIREIDPNIVLLQEVPKNRCNTVVKKFIESLADSLKMNFSFGAYGDPEDKCHGTWGTATLTKFEIKEIENAVVRSVDKYKTRSVLRTEITMNDSAFLNIFNLHHDGNDKSELGNTMEFVNKSKLQVIVGGDFNRRYDNPELNLPGLRDYFNYNLWGIDRIYGNIDAEVFGTGYIYNSNKVSDHYAMYVKLDLK